MNADSGGNAVSAALYVLIALALTASLLTGAISALVTLFRWRRDGVVTQGQSLPAHHLRRQLREALVASSIGYFACASAAVALLPRAMAGAGFLDSRASWAIAYVLFFLVLLLSSVLAKSVAIARPIGFARFVEPLVWTFHLALWPLTRALGVLVRRFSPSLRALELSPPLSGPELRDILSDREASALMEDDEADWARSIFELRDTEIREIMVPRIDMVGLEVNTAPDEAIRLAAQASYTRLPVWEGSPDKILGLVHAKDLLAAQVRGQSFTVRQLLRRIPFLPESKRVDEALSEFREGRVHLAVVVDEYGGTAGIVTLEDILEEVFGEIRDEFDQEGELVRISSSTTAIIDPRIDLDDLNDLLHLELPTEESDTLAGFIYQLLGRVPLRGDSVEHGELRFTIDRVERQRIRQVTLVSARALPNPAAVGEDTAESTG